MGYISGLVAVKPLAFLAVALAASPGLAIEPASSHSQGQSVGTSTTSSTAPDNEKSPEEPLVTDRPDFTESTSVVPVGRAQIEAGYTFTFDREDGVRTKDHTFPESLLRVGLADDWELRIGWAGWSRTETMFRERNDAGRTVTRKSVETGGTDLYLGFKHHILDQKAWRPAFAVIPAITVPTGTESKSSGDVDPEVKLAWSYELTERLAVAGNLNFATPNGESGRRFFQTASSVSMGYSFTEWLGGYVEYFGFYPNDRGSDCAHYFNGGLTFPIGDNLQFDVRAGAGLNEEADDLFAGTGLAIRF